MVLVMGGLQPTMQARPGMGIDASLGPGEPSVTEAVGALPAFGEKGQGVPKEGPGLAKPLPSGRAQGLAWSRQGLGCFQMCFHFQFPLLLKPPQGGRKQTVILS